MAIFIYRDTVRQAEYTVDTERRPDPGRTRDAIPCLCQPFHGIPLTLKLNIEPSGVLLFHSWEWNDGGTSYLHTRIIEPEYWDYRPHFQATPQQRETVAGLLSRRLTWEGLPLHPGLSLERAVALSEADIAAEEKRQGRKMYFA